MHDELQELIEMVKEKHKELKIDVNNSFKKIDKLSARVDDLEKHDIVLDNKIATLCDKLDKLINTIQKSLKSVAGLMLTTTLTLLIFLIEKHI
ncbi:MAG: hypothetical protein ACRCX8_19525 [Sarcina sp.]